VDIRQFFFKNRSYTPIPLIIAALVLARMNSFSYLAGMGIMLIGELIRFWGVAYAGSATRTTATAGGSHLITDGPFALVRNPLYIGNFFLSFGVLIMSWAFMPWMILIFIALFSMQYGAIVSLEEAYLVGHFGEAYQNYKSKVWRWIPRLTPYRDGEETPPNFRKALRSERSTAMSIVTVWILLFLRWKLF